MSRAAGPMILLTLAASTAACRPADGNNAGAATANGAQTAMACTPPRAHWMRPAPLSEGMGPPIWRISLGHQGRIHWAGRVTTLPQLSHYLGIVATMNPRPHIFLETEMGVSCTLLEQVRDEMDRRLQCRTEGSCAEGIWTVWEATPIPPGTPPS